MEIPPQTREDLLIRGKNGLETALILSTDIPKAFRRVPKEYDMLSTLQDVVTTFKENGIRFALIGGLAVGEHSIPRATKDVDFLVEAEDMEKVRGLLEEHYREGNIDFMLFEVRGVRLDLISARLRFQRRAIEEARPGVVDGVDVPLVRPRDLLLLKLVAAGDRRNIRAALQDQADAAGILEHTEGLTSEDLQYVADRILESFCFTRDAAIRYRELLGWLNQTVEKLGRPELRVTF